MKRMTIWLTRVGAPVLVAVIVVSAAFAQYAGQAGPVASRDPVASEVADCCADSAGMEATKAGHSLEGDQPLSGYSLYHLSAQWTDHRHDTFDLSRFQGRAVILTMLYTRCFGTCPVLIQDAKRVYDGLPADVRERTSLVAVTIDPDHDTPEELARYAAYRHYDRPNWHFLHGDRASVRALATALGVRYSARPDGTIAHTDRMAALDSGGVVVGTLDGILQPVGPMVDQITRIVR